MNRRRWGLLGLNFGVFFIASLFYCFIAGGSRAEAVSPTPAPEITKIATQSAEATPSSIVEKVVEKKPDITEPKPETLGKLEKYLVDNPPQPLSWTNFLQHGIRQAVSQGVPANTIVLILLFPLVAAIIAASRHLIGIRGLGIFLPAVMSVVFVSTGVVVGILLFMVIILVATAGRMIIKMLKLQYLPRMALLLWIVSLGVLAALFISPLIKLEALTAISIFPILMLILLAEQFIGLQVGKSMKEAIELTFETMLIAIFCSMILKLDFLQKFALLMPEITVILVAAFDIFMGRYTGLRWLEKHKFKELLTK